MGRNSRRNVGLGTILGEKIITCQALLLGEHPLLSLRVLDPAAGYVKVFRLYLYSDELTPEIHAGNAGSARTHEGVKD